MKGWIYLLHFDEALHHARHYMGATHDLERRLKAHQEGYGSSITKELFRLDRKWRLAGLWLQTSDTDEISLWAIEKDLKAKHCGPEYCSLCRILTAKIPYTIQYDITALPFNPHKEQ